jgi:diguanylate cyclase (GGDEF)-like protein/PAS domain S-box-containing protein
VSPLDDRAPALQLPATWQPLLEGLLEAVCVVEPVGLCVVAANAAALSLFGLPAEELVGLPVSRIAATPEDLFFWDEVAQESLTQPAGALPAPGASGAVGPVWIHSETLVRHATLGVRPVERRVSRVEIQPGRHLYVLGLRDRAAQREAEDELEKLLAELQATLESTADGILVTDLAGAIRGCNRLFAQLWSLPETVLTQRDDGKVRAWMREQVIDTAAYDARLAEIDAQPLLQTRDTLVLRSGRVLERVTLPQYGRGNPIGRVSSFRDITEALASASRLQLAAQVFESSLDAIFVTDAEHRVVAANGACLRMAGLDREALVGLPTDGLLHHRVGPRWFEPVGKRLGEQGVWEGELWCRRPDGSVLPGQLTLVKLPPDALPELAAGSATAGARHVGFFRDLSETVAAHKRIEELAYSDSLTGLPNRAMLTERIEFALAMSQRHESPFALLFLDLDRFKHINDSLGHVFGDRLLVDVAQRLLGCVRQIDTVARLGGDEFVMLLNQTDARGAELIARRVHEALGAPFMLGGLNFSVTGSVGIAMYPNDGRSMNDLIKNADAAMYQVKQGGRSGFRFYQPHMNVDLLSRMMIDHAMRGGLERGDFRLHYQPQVTLADGAVVGAEALLRWRDAELGEVSPGTFIPVAEETGFIVALGDWVLREAVHQGARWRAQGRAIVVSVNVSALQFQQPGFVDRVESVLAESGLPAEWLELELTESILVQDAEEALARLHALDRLGVSLAIDDFGTGYSSFAYLKRFPIRKLKIDRSFVKDLPGEESDAAIALAVIQVARALRLRVIAEGVETVGQRDFLREAGCDEFQGFLVSPGVGAEEFERRLAVARS